MSIALATGACFESQSTICPSGVVCPAGKVCHQTGCVDPAQVDACREQGEAERCTLPGGDGYCVDGVCLTGCGDGVVEGAEDCDSLDLAGAETCKDIGFHQPNPLACNADCTYDTSQCGAICGDDIVDPSEDCELGQPQELTSCVDLGFYDDVELSCTASCRYDVGACTGFCGDGEINGAEECDGAALAVTDCLELDFYDSGPVSCSAACRYDVSSCFGFCGDGELNGPELCESLPPAGQTCLDLGFDAGKLTCSSFCAPDLGTCLRAGWRVIADYPSFSYFLGVWGSAADDLYITGEEGLFHWDGATLSAVAAVPAWTSLRRVWGTGADDIWAIGFDDMYHFDGSVWSEVSPPAGFTADIWSSGPGNVYTVGNEIYHYDGTDWTEVYVPSGSLRALHGSGPDNIWAVGNGGLVVHYDGSDWMPVDAGVDWISRGVWTFSETDVLIGGNNGIVRYDGDTWEQEWDDWVFSFWGSDRDNMYASAYGNQVVHYDGIGWSVRPHPNNLDSEDLWGVEGSIFEVGGENAVTRFDGITVEAVESGTTAQLLDVWGNSTEAFAVGADGTIVHWDGTSWSPMESNTAVTLRAVWGAAFDDVYAAGFGLFGNPGVLVHYDGNAWQPVAGHTGYYTDIWGSGPSDVYVGGYGSDAIYYNGATWESSSPAGSGFRAVWGTGPQDVYVSSPARHYDGIGWTSLPQWDAGWTLHGSSTDNVVSVRTPVDFSFPDVYRFDGTASTNIEPEWGTGSAGGSGDDVVITDVAVSGPGDILASATDAVLLHFDGVTWTPLRTGVDGSIDLNAVAGAAGTWFAVGDQGMILLVTRDGAPGCPEAGAEVDCQNGLDDDCDFLVDRMDPDCKPPGVCWAPIDVDCGDSVSAAWGQGSSTLRNYPCATALLRAPEDVYRFVPGTGGTLSAALTGLSHDLDLVAVGATAAGACDPSGQCLGISESPDTGDESVELPVTAGEPVFLIVDAEFGGASDYTLTLTCN